MDIKGSSTLKEFGIALEEGTSDYSADAGDEELDDEDKFDDESLLDEELESSDELDYSTLGGVTVAFCTSFGFVTFV